MLGDTQNNPNDFKEQLRQRGLPDRTANIAQFIQGIGTEISLGTFGQDKGSSVIKPQFKTMDYRMSDLLDEMRYRRHVRGIVTYLFSANKILTHHLFPDGSFNKGQKFDMAKMQELVGARAEECRLAATEGPVADRVERFVEDRVAALKMENMYRNSDQARWKISWFTDNLGYGGSSKYKIITRPAQIVFPDGSVPQADPNTQTAERNLETWTEIDEYATFAQGGDSAIARTARKEAKKKVGSYGKPPGASIEAIEHMSIIERNKLMIQFHESSKGSYFACRKKPSKRRSLVNENLMSAAYW